MRDRGSRWVAVIGALKLVKGALLIAVAAGAFSLVSVDAAGAANRAAGIFHVDPQSRHLMAIIAKLGVLSPEEKAAIGAVTLAYAVIFFVEGGGLLAKKTWAEWLTVFVTGSFVPLEGYVLARHPSVEKVLAIVINVAIVIYLARRRLTARREREGAKKIGAGAHGAP